MATAESSRGILPARARAASCGKKVGVVDGVEGTSIKLTRKDSPDGNHHLIPESWVDHVDAHVHLNKNSAQTELEWQTV